MKKHLPVILKLLFAAAIIYYMVGTGKLNLHEIAHVAGKKMMIVKVVLTILTSYFLINIRWYYLLIWQGISVSFNAVTRITCIGFFFNSFMPGSIGGDLVKAFYVVKDNKGLRTRAFMTIIIDRILGLEALMLVAFAAFIANYKIISSNPQLKALALAIGFYILCSMVAAAAVFSRRIKHFFIAIGAEKLLDFLPKKEILKKIYAALHIYSDQKTRLVKVLAISILSHILTILMFYTIGREMGESLVTLTSYFTAVPAGLIALSLPIAPAGIGIGQGAFYNIFLWFGAGTGAIGATIITVYQLIIISVNSLFVFVYLSNKKDLKKALLNAKNEQI